MHPAGGRTGPEGSLHASVQFWFSGRSSSCGLSLSRDEFRPEGGWIQHQQNDRSGAPPFYQHTCRLFFTVNRIVRHDGFDKSDSQAGSEVWIKVLVEISVQNVSAVIPSHFSNEASARNSTSTRNASGPFRLQKPPKHFTGWSRKIHLCPSKLYTTSTRKTNFYSLSAFSLSDCFLRSLPK